MRNPLVFSTLACPEWSIETIIASARAFGYDGVEWRGGPDGHIKPGMPTADRLAVRAAIQDAGLISLGITAYTSFVSEDTHDVLRNVDELRRYIDLAAEIGADYVRAFPGEMPPGARPDAHVLTRIAASLEAAAEYARIVGVTIALEPHDAFVRSASIAPILRQATSQALGVIWDVGNTYGAGEDYTEGFMLLRRRLAYIHLKDGRGRAGDWRLCPVGEGDIRLGTILKLLIGSGFAGALCVEWERAWHPELDPPETALPHAANTIRSLMAAVTSDASIIYTQDRS